MDNNNSKYVELEYDENTKDNDNNCIFEIIDEDSESDLIDMDFDINEYSDFVETINNEYYNSCPKIISGKISVKSIIYCGKEKEFLEGAKVNIYRLNGICPEFVKSSLTDKFGKAEFDNLPEGCYRIIEILDKNYFEKPKYVKWNEVNINKENTEETVLVINNLKCYKKNKFR